MFTGGKCEFCGTKIHFCIETDRKGEEILLLVVARVIPSFRGRTDRAWIDQVTDLADFERLEREWNAAVDVDRAMGLDMIPAQ